MGRLFEGKPMSAAKPSLASYTPPSGLPALSPGRCQLLVLDGPAPLARVLADGQAVVVGRGEEVDLRVGDASVSRRHAELRREGATLTVADLGSHNGTRVNGERLTAPRQLEPGDIVLVGAVPIVYQTVAEEAHVPLYDGLELRQRLQQEVERALRYERPFTLVAVPLGDANVAPEALSDIVRSLIRLSDSAGFDGATLWLMLTETDGAAALKPAERVVRALARLAPEARGGVAACTSDALDAEGLRTRALAAATAAPIGGVTAAGSVPDTIEVGGQRIIVAEPAMQRIYELLRRLARSDLAVLILGETGVGKELAATALHGWSPRTEKPLVALNCAAIPESLLESELFGHEKGAFTDAHSSKPGKIEAADGGTLFLDEVGDLSPACQAKLLRVLESRKVSRLGALREREVDVRIVAATNRALDADVESGRFRRDLYYRLSAASVYLPPLRERKRELAALARAMLADCCQRLGRPGKTLAPGAIDALTALPWPGNVRELKNVLEYVVATVDRPVVMPADLPIAGPAAPAAPQTTDLRFPNIYELIRNLEIEWMQRALAASDGVQTHAAELIGMPLRTFVTKLKQYGIGVERRVRARGGR
jgi:DNA-binding NtrC family response regulator/pSer/pThr/pTyr-binding forkhead associated (FHA) protein